MKYLIFLLPIFLQAQYPSFYLDKITTSYANIYDDDVSQTVAMASNAVWYSIDTVTTFIGQNVDSTAGRLIVRDNGIYNVNYSVSFNGTAATVYHIAVHKNSVKQDNLSIERRIGTANDVGNAGGTGVLSLSVNDTLDLRVNSSGNSKNFIYTHINLSILKIGK